MEPFFKKVLKNIPYSISVAISTASQMHFRGGGTATDSGVYRGVCFSELESWAQAVWLLWLWAVVSPFGELVPFRDVWIDFSWWGWSSGWLCRGALVGGPGWPVGKQGASPVQG